jgi:hypothetical protein
VSLVSFGNKIKPEISTMFAKVKSRVFIDTLQLELVSKSCNQISGILKDDKGCICCTMDKKIPRDQHQIVWSGLNDLPYGVYTLELSHGENVMKMNLVKRV